MEAKIQELIRTYLEAERQVISRIANRLKKGKTQDIGEWEQARLTEERQLLNGIEKQIIAHLDNEEDAVIEELITESYLAGIKDTDKNLDELQEQGVAYDRVAPILAVGVGAWLAQQKEDNTIHWTAVMRHKDVLSEKLFSTHRRMVSTASRVYRDAIRRGADFVVSGRGTRIQGSQQVLNEFANRGVTGFIDRSGRSWDLASYAETAVRSETMQTRLDATTNRFMENGQDLVMVSAHGDSCPLCDPWEGRVLSLSGEDDNYPAVSEAEGDGLFHPNCSHNITAYVHNLTKTDDPTPGGEDYEARQEQRYNERQIRKWKRREEAALTDDEARKAKHKVGEWQERNRELIKDKDNLRRKYEREQITDKAR